MAKDKSSSNGTNGKANGSKSNGKANGKSSKNQKRKVDENKTESYHFYGPEGETSNNNNNQTHLLSDKLSKHHKR